LQSNSIDWDEYLRAAYVTDDLEEMRNALEQGANPNLALHLGPDQKPEHDADLLLYWAADSRREDFVRLLLEAGAKVAREEGCDSTSVHQAVQNNDKPVLELLLKADGAVALNWFDYLDRTPLMWAAAENTQEMVRLLLHAGSDVNAHNEARIGDSALRIAAERGDSEMVKLLLDAGADPLLPGWMGLTAWHKAQDRRSAEGLKVRELIERSVRRRG
jgi:ankyrin repeat protein